MSSITLINILFITFILISIPFVKGASNYVIDEFEDLVLPFGFEECQHHSPIGKYVKYICDESPPGDDEPPLSQIVYKQIWDEEICVGNWTDRKSITDRNSETSITNTGETSNKTNVYCDGSNNYVELDLYCDFEEPSNRDVYLATDVCVNLLQYNIKSMFMYLTCNSDKVNAYFFDQTNDIIACGNGINDANYYRELTKDDSCGIWLTPNETGYSFDISAQFVECTDASIGYSMKGLLFGKFSFIVGISILSSIVLLNNM